MSTLDYPSISVANKTNEQNMSMMNAWAIETTEKMNYYIEYLEAKLEQLENKINEMQEDK